MIMSKVANYSVWVLLLILAFVIYLAYFPVKVADYNQPYKVRPNVIEAGQTLTYTADFCKYKNVQASVTRTLVDGTVIFFPIENTNLPIGCNKRDIPLVIPKNTPPGVYHLEISLVYRVNPLREITTRILTDEFRVLNVCLTEKGCQ